MQILSSSNAWQQKDAALTNQKNAFLSEFEVDPLWVGARKQGKTTATVAFAGANPSTGKQADYTIYYGDTLSPSKQEKLKFAEASGWSNTPTSFSPLMETSFKIKVEDGENKEIHVLAFDSSNDEKKNYDKFIVSDNNTIHSSGVSSKDWGSVSLELEENKTAGFWFKFTATDPALEKETVMYRSAVTSGLIDGPEGFPERIRDQFDFFPPQDDDIALEKGWISRKEYEEISERFVNWVTDVSLFTKNEYQPDLLMFYAPQIELQEHKYLLTDPRQPDYTPEKSRKYMEYIQWSYKVADSVVGKTVKSLDENDHLFIVSTPELGTHGGNPNREQLRAVFMAIGPDIPRGKQIEPISNLDIAPTIYELLELQTPDYVEGKRIKNLTE